MTFHNVVKEMSSISKEKCFKYIAILFLIYVAPILINDNCYYVDDIIRLVYGNHPWALDGRPIGDLLYNIFSFAVPRQVDVYPLPLLVCLFLLAVSVVLLYRRFGQGKPWIFSLCIFPILANPFFISNLNYRYDSSFMVLALSFGILPYAMEWESKKCALLLGCVLVACAFSSYQSAVNVFIGMAAIEGYYNLLIIKNIKKAIQDMLLRVLQLLVGFLLYLKIVVPLLNTNDYFKGYNKIMLLDGRFFEKLYQHYLDSLWLFRPLFQKGGAFIFIILGILFLLITISFFMKYRMEKNPKVSEALATIFLLVLSIIISIVAIPGIVIFGEHPIFLSRVYLGFGTFMTLLLLPHCWVASVRSPLSWIVPSLCTFFLFSLGYTANNAIKEDCRYKNNMALSIIQNIDRLNLHNENILIFGNPNPAPSTKVASIVFPIIKHFLMDSQSSAHVLKRNGLQKVKILKDVLKDADVSEVEKSTLLFSTQYYKFYNFKKFVVVSFPK